MLSRCWQVKTHAKLTNVRSGRNACLQDHVGACRDRHLSKLKSIDTETWQIGQTYKKVGVWILVIFENWVLRSTFCIREWRKKTWWSKQTSKVNVSTKRILLFAARFEQLSANSANKQVKHQRVGLAQDVNILILQNCAIFVVLVIRLKRQLTS